MCSETSLPTPDRCDVDLRLTLHLWATRNKCKHSAVNELLGILREQGHNLPKDARTLLRTPRDVTVEFKRSGQYIYFGIESGLLNNLSKYLQVANRLPSIQLIVNIDGLPLSHSTNHQFWPILGQFSNLDEFLIALFYGKTKPDSADDFLGDFLNKLEKLKNDGVPFVGRYLKVELKCFLCDALHVVSLSVLLGIRLILLVSAGLSYVREMIVLSLIHISMLQFALIRNLSSMTITSIQRAKLL